MTCAHGFDAFGERDAVFLAHLRDCGECSRVLSVLAACGSVWRSEVAGDAVRAPFRERRLGRPSWKRPVTRVAWSAVLFAGLGVVSAWGYERVHAVVHEASPSAERVVAPTASPMARAPLVAPSASVEANEQPPAKPLEHPVVQVPIATPRATSTEGAEELWIRGLRRLDEGDRVEASRLFRRVVEAHDASAGLRRRATFRWAEVLLATGDAVTPRAALERLVETPDPTMAFDAAVLLERSQPDRRRDVWERYLAAHPEGPLTDEAVARERGEP